MKYLNIPYIGLAYFLENRSYFYLQSLELGGREGKGRGEEKENDNGLKGHGKQDSDHSWAGGQYSLSYSDSTKRQKTPFPASHWTQSTNSEMGKGGAGRGGERNLFSNSVDEHRLSLNAIPW